MSGFLSQIKVSFVFTCLNQNDAQTTNYYLERLLPQAQIPESMLQHNFLLLAMRQEKCSLKAFKNVYACFTFYCLNQTIFYSVSCYQPHRQVRWGFLEIINTYFRQGEKQDNAKRRVQRKHEKMGLRLSVNITKLVAI